MKYGLLALLLCLAGSTQAQEQSRPCNAATWFQHTTPTGPVPVITGKPGQRIYFCGFMFTQRGPTLDIIVTLGGGPTCEVGKIQITPQLSLPNDFALTNRIETGQPIGEPGAGLCVQTLGSGSLTGIFYFTQWGPP